MKKDLQLLNALFSFFSSVINFVTNYHNFSVNAEKNEEMLCSS